MYQPTLGRFLSRDPLSSNGVDVLHDNAWFARHLKRTRNLYGYTSNNPVNRVDPSGLAEDNPGKVHIDPGCDRDIVISEEGTSVWNRCKPGETCDADGVFIRGYPVKHPEEGGLYLIDPCSTGFFKVVDGCTAKVVCSPNAEINPYVQTVKCDTKFAQCVQRFRGGCVDPLGDDRLKRFPRGFDPTQELLPPNEDEENAAPDED